MVRSQAQPPHCKSVRELQLFVSLGSINSADRYRVFIGVEEFFRARETNAEGVDSSMDNLGMDVTGGSSAALVILAFLQADCRGSEFRKELLSLGNEFHLTRDINCNGPRIEPAEDGDLETDGHLAECVRMDLRDIQPVVGPQWQWNHDALADIQQVADELREIADQLQARVTARATRNLMRNTSDSQSEQWRTHLTSEVERIMRDGTGLEHLPQERVFMALTLTLVKGVCEQAPQLLRSLFNAALQFISPVWAR